MNRRVLIIGAPLSENKQPAFYNGVKTDMINFRNFFRSATGGAYYTSEVRTLQNPSVQDILVEFLMHPAEHYTVVFSGHGRTVDGKTKLTISHNKEISLGWLMKVTTADKKLFVVDACRNISTMEHLVGMGGPPYLDFPSNLSFPEARVMFNGVLNKKEDGTQVIYSCSPGESSKISYDGSHFSNSLLQAMREWSLYYDMLNVMNASGAYIYSKEYLKSSYGRSQTPMHYSKETNLPFAIKKSKPSFRY